MDFYDPQEFDDPQVSKGILIGSMDFGNPKVYGDTSIFDGIVYLNIPHRFQLVMKGMVSLTLLFSFAALIMIGGAFYTAIDKSEAMDISF